MGHWFKHDSDASSDLKLKALKAEMGFEGVGMWWAFLEILSAQKDCKLHIKFLSAVVSDFNISEEKLLAFLKLCYKFELLSADENYIYSESLIKRLEQYESKKEKSNERVKRYRSVTEALRNDSETLEQERFTSSSSSSSSSISNSNNKKNSVDLEQIQIPEELDSIEVRRSLAEWVEYKTKIKDSYKTNLSIQKLLKHWAKLGSHAFVEAVDRSISNNWRGLFEARGRDPTTPKLSIVQQKQKAIFEM